MVVHYFLLFWLKKKKHRSWGLVRTALSRKFYRAPTILINGYIRVFNIVVAWAQKTVQYAYKEGNFHISATSRLVCVFKDTFVLKYSLTCYVYKPLCAVYNVVLDPMVTF